MSHLPRLWSLAAILLSVSLAGAGCSAENDDDAGNGGASSAGTGGSGGVSSGGTGGGGGSGCVGSYSICSKGKIESGTCDNCVYVDCDMPDNFESCGGQTCVFAGQTCPEQDAGDAATGDAATSD